MKTRKKLLFPALFLLALLLTLMLTMFELMHSPSNWSIEENRALASAPQVSARSVWDGTLAQDAEAFYKDHIAARRLLLKLDTAIQMQVLRRAAVHDVVVGNTVLLPAPGFFFCQQLVHTHNQKTCCIDYKQIVPKQLSHNRSFFLFFFPFLRRRFLLCVRCMFPCLLLR